MPSASCFWWTPRTSANKLEKAAEGKNDHDVEQCALRNACFDHALELGTAVVGGGSAGFNEGFDQYIATGSTVGFALALLVGDGDVMLCLPRRRDAQVEGGA
jgi:hypothetical protein